MRLTFWDKIRWSRLRTHCATDPQGRMCHSIVYWFKINASCHHHFIPIPLGGGKQEGAYYIPHLWVSQYPDGPGWDTGAMLHPIHVASGLYIRMRRGTHHITWTNLNLLEINWTSWNNLNLPRNNWTSPNKLNFSWKLWSLLWRFTFWKTSTHFSSDSRFRKYLNLFFLLSKLWFHRPVVIFLAHLHQRCWGERWEGAFGRHLSSFIWFWIKSRQKYLTNPRRTTCRISTGVSWCGSRP